MLVCTMRICQIYGKKKVLSRFPKFLNSSCNFLLKQRKRTNYSFLTLKLYAGKANLQAWKPAFSGIYSNYESFLPSVYKFFMVYIRVYKCFHICSNQAQFHTQLIILKEIFQKNSYPKNNFDKWFKIFLNNIHLVKENVPTVKKKNL